jgi:hypothetical protein
VEVFGWIVDHWSWAALGATLTALVRYGPRAFRRFALMLDCELDRARWEEADRLRNGEITLRRRDVANLQADIDRLLTRSGASGAGFDAATAPASRPSSTRPTPSATSGNASPTPGDR